MWDPARYLAFADQRARPFDDLMSRVRVSAPVSEVADLGCGPGNLTVRLAERWPDAHIVGVDSSAEMIAAAPAGAGIEFVQADLRTWDPRRPVDVLVSNATLQWVPGHVELLPRLAAMIAPGGWLAFQVPANFGEPAHVLLRELAAAERWAAALSHIDWPAVLEPAAYLTTMVDLGLAADVWETTYLQVLQGDDAVLDWMSGTALRPVLAALGDAREEFIGEYRELLRGAYSPGPHGTVLPYRRIFAVCRKVATSAASVAQE